MILLLAFASLSVVAIAATLITLARDGYRAAPTVRSRIPERARPDAPAAPTRRIRARAGRPTALRPSSAR